LKLNQTISLLRFNPINKMKGEPEEEYNSDRAEYEASAPPNAAGYDEYVANTEASGNWDEEDCPPENTPDCDP
jgi:hypothetical protein